MPQNVLLSICYATYLSLSWLHLVHLLNSPKGAEQIFMTFIASAVIKFLHSVLLGSIFSSR